MRCSWFVLIHIVKHFYLVVFVASTLLFVRSISEMSVHSIQGKAGNSIRLPCLLKHTTDLAHAVPHAASLPLPQHSRVYGNVPLKGNAGTLFTFSCVDLGRSVVQCSAR